MDDNKSNVTPDQQIEQLRNDMVNSASKGVSSITVDGMNVQRMSASERKVALDEAKNASVNQFPIAFFRWK